MDDAKMIVRLERPEDYADVERLTFEAFEGFEAEGVEKREIANEHYLVRLLRDDPAFVPELDFVAMRGGKIAANIMYSECSVIRDDGSRTQALVFGPLSVKPEFQRQGAGTLLVGASLERARELGHGAVIITGHPAYYKRFGFVPAAFFGITASFGVTDAFMALELKEGYLGSSGGAWKCCGAFDAVCDEEAFMRFHAEFLEGKNR